MSERLDGLCCIIVTMFAVGLIVLVMNIGYGSAINTSTKMNNTRNRVEVALDSGYTAVVDGVNMLSLDSEFISDSPMYFNIAFDDVSRRVVFTYKAVNNRRNMMTPFLTMVH